MYKNLYGDTKPKKAYYYKITCMFTRLYFLKAI